MQVALLGTGCPVVSLERFGPATLVEKGRHAVLVDCGSGVTQRLLAAGCPGAYLDAILLTHLHSDHLVDLYQIVISSWHQGRERPQKVYGPPGTKRYVEGLIKLWAPERKQRVAWEQRDSDEGLRVEVEELEPGRVLEIGEMRITVIEVEHKPVPHAYGFIFETGRKARGKKGAAKNGMGHKVAISGDTRRCPALIKAARGADLLIHEVFVHSDMPVIEGRRSAKTISNVASYHTLSSEVGGIAAEAKAKTLVLTHFVPPEADRESLLAQVSEGFSGPVVLGEDLMRFDLEAGSLVYGALHMTLPGAE